MNKRLGLILISVVLAGSAANPAFGHGSEHHEGQARAVGPRDWGELWRTWGLEPGIVLPLVASAWLYARGVARLWRHGTGRGVRRSDAWCFAAGWLALAVALVSPLHPWGSVLFSAHMTQHELLMLVAAPLLVLGRPVVASLWALPKNAAREIVGWTKTAEWQRIWGIVSAPFVAWLIHAVVLWTWFLRV